MRMRPPPVRSRAGRACRRRRRGGRPWSVRRSSRRSPGAADSARRAPRHCPDRPGQRSGSTGARCCSPAPCSAARASRLAPSRAARRRCPPTPATPRRAARSAVRGRFRSRRKPVAARPVPATASRVRYHAAAAATTTQATPASAKTVDLPATRGLHAAAPRRPLAVATGAAAAASRLRTSGSPGLRQLQPAWLSPPAARAALRFVLGVRDGALEHGGGLARVDRQRQHGKDAGTLERRGHFDLGVLFREHERASGPAARACSESTSARRSARSRLSITMTCTRFDFAAAASASAEDSTGAMDAVPSRHCPSSSRKSSRVVRAMTSTAACADAGACSGRWEALGEAWRSRSLSMRP